VERERESFPPRPSAVVVVDLVDSPLWLFFSFGSPKEKKSQRGGDRGGGGEIKFHFPEENEILARARGRGGFFGVVVDAAVVPRCAR
jgi:hypothetical protein